MNPSSRRMLGGGLLALGIIAIVISVIGLTSGDSDDTALPAPEPTPEPAESEEPAEPDPTATPAPAEPTPTEEPTAEPTATEVPSPTPEPTATPEPRETLDEFVTQFNEANLAGDTSFAFARLHPIVIQIFGEDTCRAWMDSRFQSTTFTVVGEPGEPGSTEFTLPDGSTAVADDYFVVPVELTFQGTVTPTDASFAHVGTEIRWFTNCEAS